MSYYFSKTLPISIDEAMRRTTEALKNEGFGVITEIDVKQTLKAKIGADFRNYRILGACNPKLAYEALRLEDKIGTMLPCNVVVQEIANDQTEVAAVDPVASMQAIDNPLLNREPSASKLYYGELSTTCKSPGTISVATLRSPIEWRLEDSACECYSHVPDNSERWKIATAW